jgi:hypothetical protein
MVRCDLNSPPLIRSIQSATRTSRVIFSTSTRKPFQVPQLLRRRVRATTTHHNSLLSPRIAVKSRGLSIRPLVWAGNDVLLVPVRVDGCGVGQNLHRVPSGQDGERGTAIRICSVTVAARCAWLDLHPGVRSRAGSRAELHMSRGLLVNPTTLCDIPTVCSAYSVYGPLVAVIIKMQYLDYGTCIVVTNARFNLEVDTAPKRQ